jgi:hypothetical protein
MTLEKLIGISRWRSPVSALGFVIVYSSGGDSTISGGAFQYAIQ